jgi:ribonuclease P protein component
MASSSGCAREEVAPSLHGGAAKVARGSRSEAPVPDQRFPRSSRLTARRQFVEVYQRGRRVRRPWFTLFGIANDAGRSRMGLTVTRRAGSAVARNRIKRVLRDVFRRHRDALPCPMDIVINGQRSILKMSAERLERELLGALVELAGKVRS